VVAGAVGVPVEPGGHVVGIGVHPGGIPPGVVAGPVGVPVEPGGHVVGIGVHPGGIPPGVVAGPVGVPVEPGGQLAGRQASEGFALAWGVPQTYGDTSPSSPDGGVPEDGISEGGEVVVLGVDDSDDGGVVSDEGAVEGVSVCAGGGCSLGAGGCDGVDCPGCDDSVQLGFFSQVADEVAAPADSIQANASAIAMPSRSNALLTGTGLTWDRKLGPPSGLVLGILSQSPRPAGDIGRGRALRVHPTRTWNATEFPRDVRRQTPLSTSLFPATCANPPWALFFG
jgi:hypothetical protein